MTLHQMFDLSTMEHRHIVYAYGAAMLLQGGYLLTVANSWLRLKRPGTD